MMYWFKPMKCQTGGKGRVHSPTILFWHKQGFHSADSTAGLLYLTEECTHITDKATEANNVAAHANEFVQID